MKRFLVPKDRSPSPAKQAKTAEVAVDLTNDLAYQLGHPLSFMSWNVNGLGSRLSKEHEWQEFRALIKRERPDIIALQEVKILARRGGPRVQMSDDDKDSGNVRAKLFHMGYKVLFNLADRKYAGIALMVRDELKVKVIPPAIFNFPGEEAAHEVEGRFILIEFEKFGVLNSYVPNHGYTEASFGKRRIWDEKIITFLRERLKPLVWIGDMNVSHRDYYDLSHPAYFKNQRPRPPNPFPDPPYRGQPGCAPIEQQRFSQMLATGRLVDCYRELHPERSSDDYTWRGWGPAATAKYYGKGMRIDYTLMSRELLAEDQLRTAKAEILGKGEEMKGFMGSDHSPILLVLEPKTKNMVQPSSPAAAVEGGMREGAAADGRKLDLGGVVDVANDESKGTVSQP